MKDKVLEAYNKMALDYEKHVDTESGHNAYYERPAMVNMLPTGMRGQSALDAGCAAGWYTERLIKLGASVTAVDLSPEMVEACKRRVNGKATVFACDLTEPLPLENDSFDLIVSSLTLHYLDDWGPTFGEFRRILKPGGTFIYSVHHPFADFKLFDRPDYFAHELLKDTWNKKEAGTVEVTFYRRPLQEIVNATAEHFVIERIVEPQPSPDFAKDPQASEWYKRWEEPLSKNPHFLIMKARKR